MALFRRFHLSQEEAEARLKRAPHGRPTRGEIGLLRPWAPSKLDVFGTASPETPLSGQTLSSSPSTSEGSRAMGARRRGPSRCHFRSGMSMPARRITITRSRNARLGDGRDYERKGDARALETLDQNVRAFHAAATQLLHEAPSVLDRVGPLEMG
jgi:hypothetical protein